MDLLFLLLLVSKDSFLLFFFIPFLSPPLTLNRWVEEKERVGTWHWTRSETTLNIFATLSILTWCAKVE